MIPLILEEAYAIYREIAMGYRIGKALKSLKEGLHSEQARVQTGGVTDNVFPLLSVLFLNDTARRLGSPIGEDIPLLKTGISVIKSSKFATANEDPLSKIATFMRLFAHEYAAEGGHNSSDIDDLIAKLKVRSEMMDIFGNATKMGDAGTRFQETIQTDEILNSLFEGVTAEERNEINAMLDAFAARLAAGDVFNFNRDTTLKIKNLISGDVFMPEVWLVMIQSALISSLVADNRNTEASLGSMTLLGDAMVLNSNNLTTIRSRRDTFQKRSMTPLDVQNANQSIINHWHIGKLESTMRTKEEEQKAKK